MQPPTDSPSPRRAGRWTEHWPVALALVAFAALLTVLIYRCTAQTGGRFIYPLDDAYIHLSIGRNLAEHGVWGVTPHQFGSASSSLLWTLLLAGTNKVFGDHEYAPLILNALFAAASIIASYLFARRRGVPPPANAVMLLMLIAAAPLGTLVLSGMEHVLQIFLDVVFVAVACGVIEGSRRAPIWAIVLAPLVVMARFEGLFLVFATCVILGLRNRKRGLVVVVGLAALAPVVVHAIWSIDAGGMWMPNSVLLKGHPPSFATLHDVWLSLGGRALERLMPSRALWALILAAGGVLAAQAIFDRERTRLARALLIIWFITMFLQLQLASTGWFFRYEAYLIWLLILFIFVAAAPFLAQPRGNRLSLAGVAAAILILATIAVHRTRQSLSLTPTASRNIFHQQIQMAKFVARYYPEQTMVINDIGAISYFTKARIIDAYGLDGTEIARMKMNRTYSTGKLDELAREGGAAIAIDYDEWIAPYGGIPPRWRKVGILRIPDNYICLSSTVSFYALEPDEAPRLASHMREFSSELPAGVVMGAE